MENLNQQMINNTNYEIQNKLIKNSITFENVYERYKIEFIDNEEIIHQKEQDFLKSFFQKIKLILKKYYGDLIFENSKNLPSLTNKCE